jgi:hypothetical protein
MAATPTGTGIVDRTRELIRLPSWEDPEDIIHASANSYREDLWADQHFIPEVWIEKDALVGIIEPVCAEFRVPFLANRGNNSQISMHEAGERFSGMRDQIPVILHLSDHDPAGLDMTRDVIKRVSLYAREPIEVRRLALTMDQVEEYEPPPNPAKESDPRYAAYVSEYGTTNSWELDALSPTVIADLIRDEIISMIDAAAWNKAKAREDRNRRLLTTAAKSWDVIKKTLKKAKR